MPSLDLNCETLDEFIDRMQKIRPDAKPKWGELNPQKMFRHLRYLADISLEKENAEDLGNLLTKTILRWVFFHVITRWPKGKLKAPDYFTPDAEDFDAEKSALIKAFTEFTSKAKDQPDHKARNPVFGLLPLSYWQRVHGAHTNHHLKQFGV